MKTTKVSPSAREAEESVLSCIIQIPDLIDKIAGWIPTSDAFYYQDNQKIWEALLVLREERAPVDAVTLINKCREMFPNEQMSYLITGYTGTEIIKGNIEFHAKIIWEKHIQRRVAKSAQELQNASYDDFTKTDELLRKHQILITELQDLQPSKERSINIIVNETIQSIKDGDDVIPYGIKALDLPAGGMTRKEITILGGRPGHCKTTLAVNIVKNLVEQGYRVMVFNREMSNIAMIKKMAIIESDNLSYLKMRKGEFSEREYKHLFQICEDIKKKYTDQLFLYEDIRDVSGAMREIRRHRPDVVIDDYIQLISVDKNFSARRFEIEYLLHEYKWIAKETNCAPFLLSQLSRDIEKRFDPTPRMSDYAESGTIEQVCETALFLFRGFVFSPEDYKGDEYSINIISAKARYGVPGNYKVGFNGDRCTFYNKPEEAEMNKTK